MLPLITTAIAFLATSTVTLAEPIKYQVYFEGTDLHIYNGVSSKPNTTVLVDSDWISLKNANCLDSDEIYLRLSGVPTGSNDPDPPLLQAGWKSDGPSSSPVMPNVGAYQWWNVTLGDKAGNADRTYALNVTKIEAGVVIESDFKPCSSNGTNVPGQ